MIMIKASIFVMKNASWTRLAHFTEAQLINVNITEMMQRFKRYKVQICDETFLDPGTHNER